MTRMTGPDCAVMCNLMNTDTHAHSIEREHKILGKSDVSKEKKKKKEKGKRKKGKKEETCVAVGSHADRRTKND